MAGPVISLTRYRDLLQARDVREIFAASFIGRLPIGITGLAVLLFVQSSLGSFAQGGAAAAFYMSGLAVMAPIFGRVIDRRGPKAVLYGLLLLLGGIPVYVWQRRRHLNLAPVDLPASEDKRRVA